MRDPRATVGWDIGGAHVKACLTRGDAIVDIAQWACPLWLGLDRLDAVLREAAARWPALAEARHAVTMTGEMADLFSDREDGVRRIAATLLAHWPAEHLRFYAGDAGWCGAAGVAALWPRIASANWLATARHVAEGVDGDGVLVDIGSTTTDLIAFGGGRVLSSARSDAERLVSGELVYHGVVRTPLCALAPRIVFAGLGRNVMNEFFASTADVYRLTGELDPAHDLHPAADNAAKSLPATRQRLARMVGLDARDAADADWLRFAHAWRDAQLATLRGQLGQVIASHGLSARAVLVAAGCGAFLVSELVDALAGETAACLDYAAVAKAEPEFAAQARLCAPSVALARLAQREEDERCGW